MPPADQELSQDSFSWQPPGEEAQLCALVPPLLSASAPANQHCCPSPPWHKNLRPNLVPGTLGSESSKHYQNPALWVHSHLLGGKRRDHCSSDNSSSPATWVSALILLAKRGDCFAFILAVLCSVFLSLVFHALIQTYFSGKAPVHQDFCFHL